MSYCNQSSGDARSSEGAWEKLSSQIAVKGAEYNSRERQPHPKCLKGTRVDLLNHIYGLLDNPEKSGLIWLHGTAGVGKSAVAFTVAERMRRLNATDHAASNEKRLAGTFFFSRKHTKRSTTEYFFATLAYQLASNFPSIKDCVSRAICDNPALLDPDKSLQDQMEVLFLQPLQNLRFRLRKPLVFIVDALDECTSKADIADLISLLGRVLREPDVPVTHILLTSRSEAYIHEAIQEEEVRPLVCEIPAQTSGEGVNTAAISLDGADVDNDIYIFMKHSFTKLINRYPNFPQPTKDKLEQLVSRAGRRFIVASTMMNFLDDGYNNPGDRLNIMLNLTSKLLPGTEVYRLYDQILITCAIPARSYLHLSVVAALADPLPISQISGLLGIGEGRDVETSLRQLQSLLYIPTDNSLPVNIYHSSIRDYASNPSNCGLFRGQHIMSPHSLLAHSSLHLMMQHLPESTALLEMLLELKMQSQAMQYHDPKRLMHSLAFVVQPLEPLQVLTSLLWLHGHRSPKFYPWLQTLDGCAWLQTEGGQNWLQTEGGQDWIQTQEGQSWLQTEGGQDWLQTEGGQDWLQTQGGQGWLQTQGGQNWLQTWDGKDWLQTWGGQDWLETQRGWDWLETPGGQDWLETQGGKYWLETQGGHHWLQTPQGGQDWLQTWGGQAWLQTSGKQTWLQTQGGRGWLQTETGKVWLKTEAGKVWLKTLKPPGEHDWLQTEEGQDWLQTQGGQGWLNTWEGHHWLQTQGGPYGWLQTWGGKSWLQTQGGQDWVYMAQGGKDWLRTWRGQCWLQTQDEQNSDSMQTQEDLEDDSDSDSLQSQDYPVEDFDLALQTHDDSEQRVSFQAQVWQVWLQSQGWQDWLQTHHGQDWLQTHDGRAWLQTRSGQDWLKTSHGQAWHCWQSTPAASFWVSMEDFSSTLEEISKYMIVPELSSLPTFQVIQQFRSLPDFLMFPAFLALRHQNYSTLPIQESHFPLDIEVIHAMETFVSFAKLAQEQSQTVSGALNYACQNWAIHLLRASNPWDVKLNHVLNAFWNCHLLSWFERQWCLKSLHSCLIILSKVEELAIEKNDLRSMETSRCNIM